MTRVSGGYLSSHKASRYETARFSSSRGYASQQRRRFDTNEVKLLSDLTGLAGAEVERVLQSQGPKASLTSFLRQLAQGEIRHPCVGGDVRARLSAMFSLWALLSKSSLQKLNVQMNWPEYQHYVTSELDGLARESFLVIFLDSQNCLIETEMLFVGSVNSAAVYTRVVAHRALVHHAVSIIVAQNHPSGSLLPSQADLDLTQKLMKSLRLFDIALLDHLIVAAGRCESLKNLGFV